MANYPLLLIPVALVMLLTAWVVRQAVEGWIFDQNWLTPVAGRTLKSAISRGFMAAFGVIAAILFIPFLVL